MDGVSRCWKGRMIDDDYGARGAARAAGGRWETRHGRVFALLLLAVCARAEIVAEYRGAFAKPETVTQTFGLEIVDAQREYGIGVSAVLDGGSGSLRVVGPAGDAVHQHLWGTRDSQERARLHVPQPGTYTIEVSVDNARGQWRARVVALPARASLKRMYVSAALLIAAAFLAPIVAHWRCAPLRYAAAGAIVFALAKTVWLIGAFALDIGARYALEDAMPYAAFVWTQSVLLGLWQGVAIVLAVLVATRPMKRLRDKPANAIAVGIGAGATEMFMTGILSFQGLGVMFGGGPKSDKAQFAQAYDMAVTPLLPLVDPVTLAVQTVCGAAATLSIVYGLRARRAAPILGGGALFAAMLTAAGASRSIALFGPESRWTIAALLTPIAVIACVVARRHARTWAERPAAGETVLDAFLREHDGGAN
ncbi:MAG: hypothetical protein FJY92_02265 [Candidatus Hydrogenedentes bacterium]|nr:hypothetical protein [Candidatus Hydrogenedentota bacterium]